ALSSASRSFDGRCSEAPPSASSTPGRSSFPSTMPVARVGTRTLFVKLRMRWVSDTDRSVALVSLEIATAAFVLRTRPYGESDRIVTLITETQGKVTGIAKGAKNSRRRFAGTLEPFVHIRTVFRQRPSSDLAFLLRCEFLGVFRRFTCDLERAAAGASARTLVEAAAVAEHLLAAVTSGPLRSRDFVARARVDSPGALR